MKKEEGSWEYSPGRRLYTLARASGGFEEHCTAGRDVGFAQLAFSLDLHIYVVLGLRTV